MTSDLTLSNVTYRPVDGGADDDFTIADGPAEDLACFALWGGTEAHHHTVLDDLANRFEIVADFEVHWSQRNYNRNIARLSRRPDGLTPFAGYSPKVGRPPFRFVIVRDDRPRYTWKRSFSGLIEPSNERVWEAKAHYRTVLDEPYQVHASNNTTEFIWQAVLVLGIGRLSAAVAADAPIQAELKKDLEGADGWDIWRELLAVLDIGSEYLVLRDAESLPERVGDAGIEVLVGDLQQFASISNVVQHPRRLYMGRLRVQGCWVQLRIRFVGDGSYPTLWQSRMLARRRRAGTVFVPARDDHFFSLLYHCTGSTSHRSSRVTSRSSMRSHLRAGLTGTAASSSNKTMASRRFSAATSGRTTTGGSHRSTL